MQKKGKYSVGQVFAIPIGSCYAIGVIAREQKEVLLGYFLKQTFRELPALDDIKLNAAEYIMIKRFGSRGLDKGTWISLGIMSNFNGASWNVPVFKRKDLISGEYSKVYYDDNLNEIKTELMAQGDNPDEYPDDGLAGYGFVEKRLAKLLKC
ncbi:MULTISPECIES: Imm26 family immunity protein [Niastella]|uniref:Immunity protein 26 n=1 Tax=Niastella soli TaxID=2821487 RepID=A0ABS3Z5I6_9BACT|nr:Imm26 family immunity protein [Niastella soli]MBO9204671.1 hypothetical protein [Niastella soli]